ncbi:hypothetical protein NC981_22795 [Leptolyngbya sp. DQ-M1]|uniref:hypothetical protein n=1 Tax=Leptolyngbya sp. DQ-M1 TaxID=2933920 RepID=UPI00329881E7
MKLYRFLMSFTVALGLGLNESPKIPALAQAQLSEGNHALKVAQRLNRPMQALPNVNGIRFRALNYKFSETQSHPGLEEAIRRELSGDVTTIRYLYNSIDLDGDGRNEKIVYLVGSTTCGTGGCTMLIFRTTGQGYSLISRHTIVNNPIVVSTQKTKGWRDIVLFVGGGGGKPSYHSLKFDGSAYPSNPSTAPEVAPGTIVNGTAIVADQISPGVGIAFGQPANQSGSLTPKQQASLKSLGIAIAVPSFIPAGYTVSKVEVKPCPANAPRSDKGTCRFGPQYGIVYRNAQQDRCFAIEATGGGIGGVPAEYEVKINTQLFGETSLLFGQQNGEFKMPSSQQLNSPQPNLLTDWAGVSPFYRISGAEIVQKSYYKGASAQCRNTITPNEATKIVRSLSWLK